MSKSVIERLFYWHGFDHISKKKSHEHEHLGFSYSLRTIMHQSQPVWEFGFRFRVDIQTEQAAWV
jgi:hypothetical protein